MNWSTVKPTDIKSIHMRNEGDINSYWDLTLKDGTRQEFYGYESGPHYGSGPKVDEALWDDNEKLYEWLCDLNAGLVSIPEFKDDDGIDYDLTLSTLNGKLIGMVSNIVIQRDDGSGKYEQLISLPQTPTFFL